MGIFKHLRGRLVGVRGKFGFRLRQEETNINRETVFNTNTNNFDLYSAESQQKSSQGTFHIEQVKTVLFIVIYYLLRKTSRKAVTLVVFLNATTEYM